MIDCYKNCKDLRNGVCPPMKTFCPKKLEEHDKQVREDVIDKCIHILYDTEHSRSMESAEYISKVATRLEQLKGAENE